MNFAITGIFDKYFRGIMMLFIIFALTVVSAVVGFAIFSIFDNEIIGGLAVYIYTVLIVVILFSDELRLDICLIGPFIVALMAIVALGCLLFFPFVVRYLINEGFDKDSVPMDRRQLTAFAIPYYAVIIMVALLIF